MPSCYNLFEFTSQVLWDCETIQQEVTRLFVNPIGSQANGRLKHWRDTNMVISGMLPAPNMFLARSMKISFLTADDCLVPVSNPLYRQTQVSLIVSTRTMWESPAAEVADPLACFANLDAIDARDRMILFERLARPRFVSSPAGAHPGDEDYFYGTDGILIGLHQNFTVRIMIDRDSLGAGYKVCTVLEGTERRSVI